MPYGRTITTMPSLPLDLREGALTLWAVLELKKRLPCHACGLLNFKQLMNFCASAADNSMCMPEAPLLIRA